MNTLSPRRLQSFAKEHHLVGLTEPSLMALMQGQMGYSSQRAEKFLRFQERINLELLNHRIIKDNAYTAWFRRGEVNIQQLRAFIVQFSVFSNQFLVAQLYKTINADSLEGMRASKEILANEIGVVFNSGNQAPVLPQDRNQVTEPELVSTEGSVDGGTFHFRAAHFEWLLCIADRLGLDFDDVGKRRHGTRATLFFCDELTRLYGSEDYAVSQAASYAVENWAAAGFWAELIDGLTRFNERTDRQLPLSFFIWHDRLEAQHARHTQEELEEMYFQHPLDEEEFIRDGNCMLDGVAVFWGDLEVQRKYQPG